MTRARQRIATASAAILVQVALVALFAYSVVPGAPREAVREVMLLLPILQTAVPPQPLPPRVPRMIVPHAQAALPPILDDKAANIAVTRPSALEGIGRALFGCAPERYGQLTGPEQLRCPPPGQAMARSAGIDAGAPSASQSRDTLLWAENLAAREFMPACSDAGAGAASTVSSERIGRCVMRQTLAQSLRARQVKAEYEYARARRPEGPIWVGLVPPKR